MITTNSVIPDWTPLKLLPQVLSIAIVLLILVIASIVYSIKLKKIPVNQAPNGYVLIVQIYVEYIRNLVVEILGPRLEKITPYFLFLFSYLLLSNMIGFIGLENPTSSLTTTLTLGLIMFIGTFVIGFRYQKLSYLTRFCLNIRNKKNNKLYGFFINPLEVMSTIAPLISISFRLWGNIFAGGLVVSLWFYVTGMIYDKIPVVGIINLLGGLTVPPIHMYFDLLCALIQALVFTLLTMVYWTLALEHGNYQVNENAEDINIGKLNIVEKNLH